MEIKLHLPQEVLAQLIGATRQRVNHSKIGPIRGSSHNNTGASLC